MSRNNGPYLNNIGEDVDIQRHVFRCQDHYLTRILGDEKHPGEERGGYHGIRWG